jgi:hypothetical protein
MQKIKIQHYVPRFYLANFSRSDVINCFDKTGYKQFVANIDQIGCERYFYDIDSKTEQIVEKELASNEKEFNLVYNKLVLKKSLYCLSWKEKESFARFVAIQEIRTKEQRETIKGIGKELKRIFLDKPTSEELKKQLEEVATTSALEQTARRVHLKFLLETLLGENEFVEMYLGLKWILSENNTKMPLWTSDHPVNRFNPIDQSPFGNLGLLSRGIEISFPLTPKLHLSFCDPIEYFNNPENVAMIKDNVLFYNTLQVRSCTRHILSRDDDFSIARKWLDEYPDSKNPERKRIKANV